MNSEENMDVSSSGRTLFLVLLTNSYVSVDCTTITDMENLHSALLTGYNKDVRPIDNQSHTLNVTVYTYLRSIQDLDEVTGEFSFTGALALTWTDSKLVWNTADHGGIQSIYISYESVCLPEIVMTIPTDESDTFSKKWQKVKYSADGYATFIVGGRFLSSCSVNIENYPFDKQTCKVGFVAWGYDSTDVNIIAGVSTVNTEQYGGHNVWNLVNTNTETHVLQEWVYYTMEFHIERKAMFTFVSLMTPLLFMNFLNVLVFVLVPDSGERVSYSVTVLLAIAVFMTIISDALPPSSDPVPKITYKLMADMIISVLITVITILNMRLYHKEDGKPVPVSVQAIYRFVHSSNNRHNKETTTESPRIRGSENGANEVATQKYQPESYIGNINDVKVTWKDISNMVDNVSLVVFSTASVMTFVVYVITATSY